MASPESTDWVVAVYSGPSSTEVLLPTLVGWARRFNLDPRKFNLWFDNGGKTLVLHGFTGQMLSDFIAYARSQCYPPLVCGPPSQRVATQTMSPEPPPLPSAPPPPPPPADSSPLMQGVLQVLTDRETAVKPIENRLMEIFGTLNLNESEVLWSLYLSTNKEVKPALVALASSPSLRAEGVKMLSVPEDKLPVVLFPSKPEKPEKKAPTKQGPEGEEEAAELMARIETYKRVLDANATHWGQVLERMQTSTVKEGSMSAAVVVDEGEGKVTWVFPRATSPVVKAITACVLHLHESAFSAGEKATLKEVRDTVIRASRLAKSLGLSLRWYMVASGRVADIPEISGEASTSDTSYLNGLLAHYGGATWILAKPEPPAPKKAGKAPKVPKVKLKA